MAKELKPIDVSNIPELLRLAQQVRDTQESCVLQQDSEDIAVLRPVKPTSKRRARGRVFTKDDPLYQMVGSATSDEPSDAAKKHEYLAQAHGQV